ncbi:hypothetical protein [Winogradskyella sp. 3972H.M.0a.05]|uniref:hypothetical protein n=1 Tax=Winogradskyella sp. 3972H.M.0a.05 TaxID=2950277 RepID=UPI00339396AA
MAPIKFEENMKEKLEKRTIQPSSEAWSKLAGRLDEQESSSKRFGYWWIGIAASVAILIFSGVMFINNEEGTITPEIVDTTEDTNDTIEEAIVLEDVEKNDVEDEITIPEEKKDAVKPDNILKQPKAKQKANQVIKTPKKELVAFNDTKKETEQEESVVALNKAELSFEEQKVKDVIAQITTLNDNGTKATDREIDSLLNLAQKELLSNKIFNESSKTVDADALLQDVEGELEQSFRAKVFDALKNSYDSVKTAVAERNN